MKPIKGIVGKVLSHTRIESTRSRQMLLFLGFVVISAMLWCFVTFNSSIVVDVAIPVRVTSVPEQVRFLTPFPDTINITVSDRGTTFLKYLFRTQPSLDVKFDDYVTADGHFKVDLSTLKRLLARKLARSTSITAIQPEGINVKYTDEPGKLVPVVLDIEVQPDLLYAQTGPIHKSHDSVMVYSDATTLKSISEVYSYHVSARGLTDTLRRKVGIAPLKGAVVEPQYIDIAIPIEKLVTMTQKVQVAVRNAPEGIKVIVFPSSVDASFMAPQNFHKTHTNAVITAVVDYNAIVAGANKVPVRVGEVPAVFKNVQLSLDSVEYIIEK